MINLLKKLILTPSSLLNKLKNRIVFLVRDVIVGTNLSINGDISVRGHGQVVFGDDVKINSGIHYNPVGLSNRCLFYVHKGAKINIGNNVGISNALLYARSSITIKDNVLIGGGCQILDNDFHPLSYDDRISNSPDNILSEPIIIEEGAFVGANAILLKGVKIGSQSIIAAGAVVSKSVPAKEIWGGNPAKFIKSIE